jgi:hypothetical protein
MSFMIYTGIAVIDPVWFLRDAGLLNPFLELNTRVLDRKDR